MHPLAYCDFGPGQYLVFGPDVGPLQYYSHIPIIAIALLMAGFVFFNNRKSLANQILFGTIITYTIWVFLDSVIWASNASSTIMFSWATQIMIEPLVYIGSLYLLYVLVQQRDTNFKIKLVWTIIYLPLVLTSFTSLNLLNFDVGNCLATEGFMGHYYSYAIEFLYVIWIVIFSIYSFFHTKIREERMKILYMSLGIFFFLMAFSWGNIVGSFTDNWQLGQYGLFGLPIFSGFLVYSIVRYKTFNVKLIGPVALVVGLIVLTFSLLFVDNPSVFREVAFATFIFSIGFGYMLIRSVSREVAQRERIEKLAGELEKSNKQQVVLIHFITHQIKGFLTKSRNIFAMAIEGDFGPLPEAFIPMAQEGLRSGTQGVTTVQEILNASNVKSGAVTYTMAPFDLGALVDEVVTGLKPNADAKKLALTVDEGPGPIMLTGDKLQLQNAFKNLIDNSIKYTQEGSVAVSLKKEDEKIRFMIQDTGVGITPEDMAHLFTEGGHGKDSIKVNVESTGFGLYIVKNIIEAHHGKVWAESEGAGKGSKFIVELPVSA
jgi:signal transduction histidine kinase